MLGAVDPADRVVIVEDSAELLPNHPHTLRLVCRTGNVEGSGRIELRDLVRQALRMRPDRLVVGEVRGPELVDLLVALNTGHRGCAGTLHANSAADVPARLVALAGLGGMPEPVLQTQLAPAVQVVVHLQRDVRAGVVRRASARSPCCAGRRPGRWRPSPAYDGPVRRSGGRSARSTCWDRSAVVLTSVRAARGAVLAAAATGLAHPMPLSRRGFVRQSLLEPPAVIARSSSRRDRGRRCRAITAGRCRRLLWLPGPSLLLVRSARRRRAERTRRQALLQTHWTCSPGISPPGPSLTASVERVALVAPAAIRPLLADVALRSRFGAAPAAVATDRIDAALLSAFAVAGRHGSATAEVLSALRRDTARRTRGGRPARRGDRRCAAVRLAARGAAAGRPRDRSRHRCEPDPGPAAHRRGWGAAGAGTALCCAGLLWSARLAR